MGTSRYENKDGSIEHNPTRNGSKRLGNGNKVWGRLDTRIRTGVSSTTLPAAGAKDYATGIKYGDASIRE